MDRIYDVLTSSSLLMMNGVATVITDHLPATTIIGSTDSLINDFQSYVLDAQTVPLLFIISAYVLG